MFQGTATQKGAPILTTVLQLGLQCTKFVFPDLTLYTKMTIKLRVTHTLCSAGAGLSRGHSASELRGVRDLPIHGRAIAQAVSRWLPTAAVRVRSRVWSSGICGG
jgi:hypothetical protein